MMSFISFKFFIILLIASFQMTESALFFKKQNSMNKATSSSVSDSADKKPAGSTLKTKQQLHLTVPSRLPQINEDITFDVPIVTSSSNSFKNDASYDTQTVTTDSLLMTVTHLYDHPDTRMTTVSGYITTPETNTASTSAGDAGVGRGTFTLTCQASLEDLSQLTCLANIRPFDSGSIQYELRYDSSVATHVITAIDVKTTYEPRVQASDFAADFMNVDRLVKDPSQTLNEVDEADVTSTSHHRRLVADTNDILDLFIVWTPQAQAVVGSANAMSLYMTFVVDEANYVLENSQVNLRLRITRAAQMTDTSYTEPGTDLGTILNQATYYSSIGYPQFDADQNLRYTYKADALVIIAGNTAGNQCGIAWLTGTMIHELGHNLGCTHDLSASTVGEGLYAYSHGYCWDQSSATSCDGTCGRSTMSYAGCVTPLGCQDCNKYDYFSNPNVFQGGSATGTSALNNALSIQNSRRYAIAVQESLEVGGLIFSVEPNLVPLNSNCFTVVITGWMLGSGADISSVTLAPGIISTEIISQTKNSVTAKFSSTGAVAGTSSVVVTSASFSTTLPSAFTFSASDTVLVTETFQSKLDEFYQSDDSVGWYYLDTYCPTSTGSICEKYGPASGDGMFALVKVDGSGRNAAFEAEFSSAKCYDTVSSLSVKYYAYSVSPQCFSSGFLSLQVRYTAGGAWTTVASTSDKHTTNSQSWKTLSVSALNKVVYGVKVLAKTSSSLTNCDYFNPVAIDDITVSYTSDCSCAHTVSPTITVAPTTTPTNSSSEVEEKNEKNIGGIEPTTIVVVVAIGLIIFCVVMSCFCLCDKLRARNKQRRESLAQGSQFSSL